MLYETAYISLIYYLGIWLPGTRTRLVFRKASRQATRPPFGFPSIRAPVTVATVPGAGARVPRTGGGLHSHASVGGVASRVFGVTAWKKRRTRTNFPGAAFPYEHDNGGFGFAAQAGPSSETGACLGQGWGPPRAALATLTPPRYEYRAGPAVGSGSTNKFEAS